jgi:type VI secretion system secreted protein VgrG
MADRMIEIAIDGASLVAHAAVVHEHIGKAFVAHVRCVAYVAEQPTPALGLDLVGKKATVTLALHGIERKFVGLVDKVQDRELRSVISVVSRIGWLEDTRDYRTFVDKTARQIVDTVLGDHAITVDWKAQKTPAARKQTLQGFESDLGFVARVLAEEGMCWYPMDGEERKIVVSDAGGTFVDLGLTLPYREQAGLEVSDAVHGARLVQAVTSDKAVLRDYDFTHPTVDLQGESGSGGLEWYEYPGHFLAKGEGDDLAAVRLAERRREEVVLEGEATAPKLSAGGVFSLEEAPVEGQSKSWLVLSVSHHLTPTGGAGELNYESRFRAVPADRGYRPERTAPPARRGVTTATVTGSSGSELHHDEYGRIHALLRWERRLPADDTASTNLRVMQPQLSGAVFNPRTGWEQIVAHSDRDGEMPLTLGRLYNGTQRPPATLPGGKVETHYGTWTTPKGSGGNFTKVDDTAGKEKLLRNASKDFNERTEKDKVRKVKVNEKRKIGAVRKHMVKQRRLEQVDGHQGTTVAGLRSVRVENNFQLTAASENVIVGAARLIRVGGDYVTITPKIIRIVVGAKGEAAIEQQTITTKGVMALAIGGSLNVKALLSEAIGVGGLSTVGVSGAQNINCEDFGLTVRGIYSENFANRTATASGNIGDSFKALSFTMRAGALFQGSDVAFEASARMIIKGSGCTVTITPGAIVVKGEYDGATASVEEGNHEYG